MASYYQIGADVTGIITREGRACADCNEAHFVFVNRDGATRCLICDGEYVRRRALADEMFKEAVHV